MATPLDAPARGTRNGIAPGAPADPDVLRLASLLRGAGSREQSDAAPAANALADAAETRAFLDDKPAGRHKIRVRASAAGDATVVEVLNDDMPFLVDSVMGEIQARGLSVRHIAHPILVTERTGDGRLTRLLGAAGQTATAGCSESLICVQLAPLSPPVAADLGRALSDILGEVRIAVADWKAMLSVVDGRMAHLSAGAAGVEAGEADLAARFLAWLVDGHFTFLGASELRLEADGTLRAVEGTALGLLRDPHLQVLRRGGREIAITREHGTAGSGPIVVAKASAMSRIHRRVHLDYVAVRRFTPDGQALAGETRFVGLFTSKAYTASARTIPLLGHKIEQVLARSGYPAQSHAGKALVNILDTFPRDELFQIGADDLLSWSDGILDLEMRPRVRVFARPDAFERFISLLLYAPRERWTTRVREEVGRLFAEACRGRIAAFTPFFLEGPLLRAHFIVATPDGGRIDLDTRALEGRITRIMRTWQDDLGDALATAGVEGVGMGALYTTAFPPAYAETFDATRAVDDMRRLDRLADTSAPLVIDLYRRPDDPQTRVRAAILRFGDAIRLSERVPVLENLGFTVVDERSYTLTPTYDGRVRDAALHDMLLETADGSAFDIPAHERRVEDAFRAVFDGLCENDLFNRLVVPAGADWREAALLRSVAAYLRQINAPFGVRYIAETLVRHAGVARDLVELFHIRFDPDLSFPDAAARAKAEAPVRARIDGALNAVASADEDRILRLVLAVLDATVRTNFYRRPADPNARGLLSLKLDTQRIEQAPAPRPYREIWVASPRVEGVHLRFAPIARGGLRWSDRAQDFRTEVLGLVKAQLVKNAVIVPSGAKGGFLPKLMPRTGSRDEILKEGVAAYRLFVSALLDITDNIVDGRIVPPDRVVRRDGDDPYLVVAADKGTATFSDYANALSAEKGHWLGDAFASGGSVGYDHKKMGITARGAWECVKRHFREMDIDIQATPFRVIGVGDMSGDVFGNGMLLSPVIRLVAAFDHRDIFIDPEPDAAMSLAERARLFALPRSSWQDYDRTKISTGGGVFSRAAKTIPLSTEMRTLLGIDAAEAAPAAVMRAILKAPADLAWFGGIGTYVRATTETDDLVGDRANDAVRVSAGEFGAKVVGEGANLGLTQRARVELAGRGVRLNTDFIDNSAGVNSSDIEVNIKIALGRASTTPDLAGPKRAAFLASMTDEVAARCLVNNYAQSLALSLAAATAPADGRNHVHLMQTLEARHLLDRRLEALPGDGELTSRMKAGRPLTRPELALLLSYAKIALTEDLLASGVPDLPVARPLLFQYMPQRLADTYADDVAVHRLRREIVATAVTNALVNRVGPATPFVIAADAGRTTADVATAYLAIDRIVGVAELWGGIDALDGRISGSAQIGYYLSVRSALERGLIDLLRDGGVLTDFDGVTAHLAAAGRAIVGDRDQLAPPAMAQRWQQAAAGAVATGVPPALADALASLPLYTHVPAIARIAKTAQRPLADVARLYLGIAADLRLDEVTAEAGRIRSADTYDTLAVAQALRQLAAAHEGFVVRALARAEPCDPALWRARNQDRLAPLRRLIDEIAGGTDVTVARIVVAATGLREAADAS